MFNKTTQEIVDFNYDFYGGEVEKKYLAKIIKIENVASEEIYWNLWIKDPEVRGVHEKHKHEGDICFYFTIVGDNCDPLKFQAYINWSRKLWYTPNIRIMHNLNYVKDCIDEI
ncbi:hypothetical protein ACFLZG_01635 [Thermodesulfobacteriota bacterium]